MDTAQEALEDRPASHDAGSRTSAMCGASAESLPPPALAPLSARRATPATAESAPAAGKGSTAPRPPLEDRSGATGGARPLDDVREGDTNGSNGSVEHAKLHGSAIDGGPGGSSAEGPPNRAEDKSIAAAAAAALGLGLRLGSGESSLANGDRDIVNSDNAVETRRPDSNGNGKDGALSGSTQAEVEGLTVNPASTSMEESTEEVDVEAIRAPGAKEERSQGATAEAQEPIAATTAPSPVDGGQETSSSTAELQRQQQQPDEHSYSIGGEDWLDGDQEDAADGLDRDGDGRAVGGGGSNVVLVSRDGGGAGVEEEKGVILPGESVAGGGPSPGGARVGSGGSSVDGGEVGGGRAPEAGIGVGGGGEAYAGPGDLAWIPSTPPGKALHEAQVGRSFEDSRLQRSTTDLERMPATRLLRPTSKYMHEDLAEAKKRQNQRARAKRRKRLSFADEHGDALFDTLYHQSLHYSKEGLPAPRKAGGCCIIS